MRGFWLYQILNMSEFYIFINFCKYDRVLNRFGDAIMELNIPEFWICQVSPYMPQYVWIMSYGRVLVMPGQCFRVLNKPLALHMPGLRTKMRGSQKVLNMPKQAWICLAQICLIMSQYVWICLNMTEYANTYLKNQSAIYARILNVSDAVHSIRSL